MIKVTHYMYSCDTSCMNREGMTEIVSSVKIRTKWDISGIMRIVNEIIRQNVE